MKKIVVIEDETNIARVLKIELEYEGYDVHVEHEGRSGLNAALEQEADLILQDVMLPGLNGIEILRRIRKAGNQVPVILLTARNQTMDKVTGLDQGANDYITKPFEIEELLARIRACLRDYSFKFIPDTDPILSVKDVKVNLNSREVTRAGHPIELTLKEYELLTYLLSNKNKVVPRENILLNVWGYDFEGETNIIDVYISYLRKKLEEGSSAELITTVRGVGYTIKEN
ncbi:response regulator transcription factor [Pseudalkalibacillus caeni]|uniref:Response regulator transcription factor n=1 Tax=Exobacillus caeni TaxID=2574798 RepID=A0A5R9F218_9BACL|nr:response regulator transcription factor [Pseudalkalibacillus caeni]TLS36446.1 response regulator transcription factor [Pseudalkalibacillus caeni]